MAYENGRYINRYEAKMKGKRRDKKRHAFYWNNKWWQYLSHNSNVRKYYHKEGNRLVRRYKDFIPNGKFYKKLYDDWWWD